MLQKIKRCILLAVTIAVMVPVVSGFAATPKQEALNAYNRWLSGAKVQVMPKGFDELDGVLYTPTPASQTRFAIAYINNDSIPELIVQTSDGVYQSILTYRNGKIVRIDSSHIVTGLTKGYYSKTGVFVNLSKYFGHRYMMMGASGVTERFSILTSVTPKEYYYYAKNGKSTPLKNHTELRNKLMTFTKGKALTPVKFYGNNAANRKNILK